MDLDHGAMEEFNDCINDLDIEECPGKGFYYTCCNKREDRQGDIVDLTEHLVMRIGLGNLLDLMWNFLPLGYLIILQLV